MLRHCRFLILIVLSLPVMWHVTGPSKALAVDNGAGQVPSLKETLNYGLKARLPDEFAFIRRVVEEVDNKRLSRKMVLQTFTWARRQSDEMPFVYFQFALRTQARKIGVRL